MIINYTIMNSTIFNSINTNLTMKEMNNNFIDNYKIVVESVFKAYRSLQEFDKYLKFIQKDPVYSNEIPLKAVFHLEHDEYPKSKNQEVIVKKGAKKTTKITYDPEIFEKFPITVSCSEKMRIIVFNATYEKIIRHNMIECINKLYKIEHVDKDAFKLSLEENYNIILHNIMETEANERNVDLFEYYIRPEGEVVEPVGMDDADANK